MSEFVAWPSIGKLSDAARNSRGATVTYRPKVKLHGTNAAIRVDADGTVTAQSRTKDLKPGKDTDNYGFAAWVEAISPAIEPKFLDYVIFGEWYGAGVQKSVALAQLPGKHFAPFAVLAGNFLHSDPVIIKHYCVGIPCHVLPWFSGPVTVDFSARDHDALLLDINTVVESIDKCCPFAQTVHGVTGHGEGLVYFPDDIKYMGLEAFGSFAFKAKGASHRQPGAVAAVTLKARVSEDVQKFVDDHLGEPRLQQGLHELGIERGDLAHTGEFIKWCLTDVEKETTVELSASGFGWKLVSKALGNAAAAWFKAGTAQ